MSDDQRAAAARNRRAVPLRAVLFDLDGTLRDTLPALVAAANRMMTRHDRPSLAPRAIMAMVGDSAGALVARAFAATGGPPAAPLESVLADFLADYEPNSSVSTRPWPGVPETLAALRARGLDLAVCTNKPARATARVLERLDLARHFDLVLCADEVPAMKPDPAHVVAILDRLGVPAAAAAMVGDHHNDVAAARGAGVRAVALSFGYAPEGAHALGADLVVDDFRDLPRALGLAGPPVGLEAMLPRFEAEMRDDLAAIEALAAAGAAGALADRAHAARGKASMFGAEPLAESLARLEHAARDGAPLDACLAALAARVQAGGWFAD